MPSRSPHSSSVFRAAKFADLFWCARVLDPLVLDPAFEPICIVSLVIQNDVSAWVLDPRVLDDASCTGSLVTEDDLTDSNCCPPVNVAQ